MEGRWVWRRGGAWVWEEREENRGEREREVFSVLFFFSFFKLVVGPTETVMSLSMTRVLCGLVCDWVCACSIIVKNVLY